MSILSLNQAKPGVQDMLAALPAQADLRGERARGERTRAQDTSGDKKPGFNELLRDSASSKRVQDRVERADTSEQKPKTEAQDKEKASAQRSEDTGQRKADQSKPADKDSARASEKPGSEAKPAQEDSRNGQEQSEVPDEAQAQMLADVSANLVLAQGVTDRKLKVDAQEANAQQAAHGQSSTDGAKVAKHLAQAQAAAASSIPSNGGGANQAQAAGQAAQADAAAGVQPVLQPDNQSQTNTGDAQSESKPASHLSNATSNNATQSNTAAATSFTLPQQPAGDARLAMTPGNTAQAADAARQAQVQQAVNAQDNDSLNTARLTRGLANAVQQRGGAVTLRLTPPEMGTVRIQMQITGTNVSASFHAESSSAQTLLTNQLAQLRAALEGKGMTVERLSVQPMASTTASQNASQSQNQSQSQGDAQQQNQQQSSGDGRSRGQYSGDTSGRQSPDHQQDNSGKQQARRGFFDRLSDAANPEAA